MLQIKTIVQKASEPEDFDREVNAALAEGWGLVRRDVLPETLNGHRCFYAELERDFEEAEEEPEAVATAEWRLSRTPALPFKCTACGYHSADAPKTCPNCGSVMTGGLE